ncbi:hypothetical protein [Streptomyces arboris]|uniref:Uncharacterized protein n=1 Tax=Streptomyces arboris TaxID=2600619 RepID=A0A5N5F6K8_9ACTN|nr:hypothetical protein [Streptomyces arboris]KAB2594264.1 hypothetical protein F5983_00515 [Streptomyces arboris]
MNEQLPSGGHELSPDEIEALDARWSSSWSPGEVARRLAGIDAPWYVAAGWALDLTASGGAAAIPGLLAPELVLLFKAKHRRPKDQADLDATVPYLSPAQRATLTGLLTRVHPGHVWLADL